MFGARGAERGYCGASQLQCPLEAAGGFLNTDSWALASEFVSELPGDAHLAGWAHTARTTGVSLPVQLIYYLYYLLITHNEKEIPYFIF